MLIEGALVFNAYRKIFEKKSVWVRDSIFADIDEDISVPPNEERLNAAGQWLIPGLVDIHMHIESSMTVPEEFSCAALPAGTCTVVADPHEIANVFGAEGIRRFIEAETEMDIFYGLPSSVPSTSPLLETTGGQIGPAEITALAADNRVICLGEVMNAKELAAPGAVVPGTVSEMVPDTTASPGTPGAVSEMVPDTKNRTQAIVEAFKKARPRFPLEGHCPKISGPDLSAFIAAGVWSDHTQQTPASLLEKIGKGMFIEMQKKSLSKENIETIIEHRLFEHIALVTDDVMPDELEKGHLNLLVKKAIELGMRPEDAIYSAAYSPSRHMMLRDRGAIAPGRIADFILLTDLHSFEIAGVYKRGRLVDASARNVLKKQAPASNGGAENSLYKNRSFPPHFYTSIRRRCLDADGLTPPLPPDFQGSSIGCVTIRPDKASTFTGRGHIDCAVRDGKLCWQEQGLSLIAVVERYGHEAPVSFGLVEWNLLPKGAIASSWAHDHHNILVMGTDEKAMAQAVNRIIAIQGGLVVVQNGQIAAEAPLPVGGIVSDEPLPALAAAIRQVRKAMVNLGYKRGDEIMSFGTLSLLVSPELKISDRGLVDVKHQELVNLYETPQQ